MTRKESRWSKKQLKRLEKYLKSAKDFSDFKQRVIKEKSLPRWRRCYDAAYTHFRNLVKKLDKNWVETFLKVPGNAKKFKAIYESSAKNRLERLINEFPDFNLGDTNRRKVLARRLGLITPVRGGYVVWFKLWQEKKPAEVEVFKKLYSDPQVSANVIFEKIPILENSRSRMTYAAARLGLKANRAYYSEKAAIKGEPDFKNYKKKLISLLKNGPKNVDELSERLDISKENVYRVAQMAIDAGYTIVHDESSRTFYLSTDYYLDDYYSRPPEMKIYRNSVKIGLIGNTKLGDISEQITLLYTVYNIFEKEKVDFVIHCGDLMAGASGLKQQNLFLEDLEKQIDYVVKYYPLSKKFKTHIVGGVSEKTFQKAGISDPLGEIYKKRPDLVPRGYGKDNFPVKNILIRVVHPLKRIIGHPYARSVKPQKDAKNMISTMIPELTEKSSSSFKKPQIGIIGRWRVAMAIPSQEGIPIIAVPSLTCPTVEDEEFIPDVGALIVELFFDSDGNLDKEKPLDLIDIKLDAYVKKDDYLISAEDNPKWNSLSNLEKTMLKLFEESTWGVKSIGELSRRIKKTGVSERTIIKMYQNLVKNGYNLEVIKIDKEIKQLKWKRSHKEKFKPLNLDEIFTDKINVGLISDTHLGSNYQQKTLLTKCYKIAEAKKVDFMIHGGDIDDGNGEVHKRSQGKRSEVHNEGATRRYLYITDVYPKSGLETLVISGNHDLWWMDFGFDIVDAIARLRPDIKYLGKEMARFERKGFIFYLIHPDAGPAYALSYKPQKYIEALVKEAISKSKALPHLVAFGNWHTAFYFGYLGVAGFSLPCLQEQTPYEKRKGLIPDIGMWIVEITKDKDGHVTRNRICYYDFCSMTKENDY